MQHILFTEADTYPVALLIKSTALNKTHLITHYTHPLGELGIGDDQLLAFSLEYDDAGKCPAKLRKQYLGNLLPALQSLGVHTLYCCDGEYFKTLTNQSKAEPHHGSVLPCAIQGFEEMNVVLGPNYQGLFYNPALQQKLDLSLETLAQHLQGSYRPLGEDIIHYAYYPQKLSAIEAVLRDLHRYPMLSCDIEAFSLKFWEAGIGTVGFAWDQHNGIAFPCDYEALPEPVDGLYGKQINNQPVKLLLREFFETYEGTLIWHNAGYDAKVKVYELWMDHLQDEVGKQKGIEIMTRKFHDTKLITYLTTNSCAGNRLSLKDQAHEFAGNYAESEIDDIRRIPLPDLLRYNLVDCLSTWYVYNKHYPTMLKDQQETLYNEIFIPSVKLILQMELTGMPLDRKQVARARTELEAEIQSCMAVFTGSRIIQQFEAELTEFYWEKDYQDRKAKAKHPEKIKPKDRDTFPHKTFNPNSNPQLQHLLYRFLELPVIDLTDTKQPATGADTLEKLKHRTHDAAILELLTTLIRFFEADKILGTFIKAMEENSIQKADGHWYLHGNFNLGGTKSGRLSSSGPNLQNLPSTGSKYAKLIKQCFAAPPGWLFCGADFASLEDRISALTTKDPNKLKVYTDGYDGHCLRAYYYFGDQMPDIRETVESINSIAKQYKHLRQKSKTPTFALTYGGTYHAIMDQTGLPEAEARAIEDNYHRLYSASDAWVQQKLEQASKDGYVTVAFGLRLRTPLLKQVLWNSKRTPYEAQAEGRTAGNALGQSYGMLNNRAGIEFQDRTLASDYRLDILPAAHIHDAQYFLIRDHIDVVTWANQHLGDCMQWQELPEIQHPDVKLFGELDIFYPNWAHDYTLPNGATKEQIKAICNPPGDQAA